MADGGLFTTRKSALCLPLIWGSLHYIRAETLKERSWNFFGVRERRRLGITDIIFCVPLIPLLPTSDN